ncbi:MAG: class I SAM-dependent methyltransferase [Myxococcota bacterium]
MNETPTLDTSWTRAVRRGERPTAEDLVAHLRAIHSERAGFTEACARRCRDEHGRNSYEWLLDTVEPDAHRTVLDLACGSGVLIGIGQERYPAPQWLGVDMSPKELELARRRADPARTEFFQAMAQRMPLASATVDAVLCHWALTLMAPVMPVLHEVARVLKPGGMFAAIVDGPDEAAPVYGELHDIIYEFVQKECPGYGNAELGDSRVRRADSLRTLIGQAFPGAETTVESNVVRLPGEPRELAEEAAGFFYASFVLSERSHEEMLQALVEFFESQPQPEFAMPINRLIVQTK